MLTMRPSNARRNSPLRTRMNPASATISTRAASSASMKARSASSSSFVRNCPGGMNRAGILRSPARARIPASATSESTTATRAGKRADLQASAMATKFEPVPEPRTPRRNSRLPVTESLLPTEPRTDKEKGRPRWSAGVGTRELACHSPGTHLHGIKASEHESRRFKLARRTASPQGERRR